MKWERFGAGHLPGSRKSCAAFIAFFAMERAGGRLSHWNAKNAF